MLTNKAAKKIVAPFDLIELAVVIRDAASGATTAEAERTKMFFSLSHEEQDKWMACSRAAQTYIWASLMKAK